MNLSWPADARSIIHFVACQNQRVPPIRARDLAGLLFNHPDFHQLLSGAGLTENGCFTEILRHRDAPGTPAGSGFYDLDNDLRIVLTRPCDGVGAAPQLAADRGLAPAAPLAAIATRPVAPGGQPFSMPRSIRQAMRDALANGPLLPNDLVTAVIGLLATDQNMAIPESPADQKKIVEDVGDKIAKTIDGVEFRIELFGDDRNKIRYFPQ